MDKINKGRVSIILPSRNEPHLKKTIGDLLAKATGDIEIYAILDGWWDEADNLSQDPRVSYIHFPESRGMRNGINSGAMVARGEFLMKLDAHCMVGEGFDEILKKDCEKDWIVVPRRYALDVDKWAIEERSDDKYPIDEMILNDTLQGVPTKTKFTEPITDLMTSQGSCWFMRKAYFEYLELMDEETYGTFWQEMQEVGFKCWLSGGRVVRNINTWYAHYHKTGSRGYSLPPGEKEKTREMIDKWKTGDTWHKQRYPLDWLFDKFKK